MQMMNRSCLLRTLQRPRAGLRKGTRRSLSASSGIGQTSGISGAAGGAAAAAAAAEDSSDVNREIAILKKLDHPNVVKLYEVGCWVLCSCTSHALLCRQLTAKRSVGSNSDWQQRLAISLQLTCVCVFVNVAVAGD
jgi:serine/threonine protein kinase